MTTVTDLMPFVGTIGGGFFVGLLAGYAIKKILKIAAVIVASLSLRWRTWSIDELLM